MAAKTSNGVKGTPQDRRQTKLTQGKTGSVVATSRGRRKLDFDAQRFKGKTMFLDLAGYRRISDIEYELTERGATIEKFFHRGVRYLVTNRPNKEGQKSQSTPSPHTPGTAPSVGKSSLSQLVSPLTDSPVGAESRVKQPPAYQTRAQKMLQMSLEKQKHSSKVDIVTLAAGWGCKVVQLGELLTELKKLKPLPRKEESQKATLGGQQAKVRQLHAPFLKVEDLSRSYRPLICEMKEWPHPDPCCSPKACPFDSPRRAKALQHATWHPRASPHHPHPNPQPHPPPVHPEEKRPGYCECCTQKYEDLHKHLRSAKHQEYASNPANFIALDSLIAHGTSFAAFIAGVKRKHEQQPSEEEGSTPAKRHCPSRQGKTTTQRSPRKHTCNPAMALSSPTKPSEDVILISPPTTPAKCNKITNHKSTPTKQNQSSFATVMAGVKRKHEQPSEEEGSNPAKRHCPSKRGKTTTQRSPRKHTLPASSSPTKPSEDVLLISSPTKSNKINSTPTKQNQTINHSLATTTAVAQQPANQSACLLSGADKQPGNISLTSDTGSTDFPGFSPDSVKQGLPSFVRRSPRLMKKRLVTPTES